MEEAKTRVMNHCRQLRMLAKQAEVEDFNVVVSGNRVQRADNFYFISLEQDMLSKSNNLSKSDFSYIPPSINAQYFSVYSDQSTSVGQFQYWI